ncbi:MAG: IclR family transcriptional regulator [Actinomycetota bacterium]
MTGRQAPAGTQAVNRTLDVLECFLADPRLGVTEVAGQLELSPSTAHRLIRALVARGYLEQEPDRGQYTLGPNAALFGQVVRRHFEFDRVLAVLERIGDQTGESINMGLLDGSEVVVAARVPSPQPLRFEQPVGTRLLPHCSSMGKALLAFEAPNGPSSIDELELVAVTDRTITDHRRFADELASVRERGYSSDDEESIIGVSCVGAPILNRAGRAKAALAIQAPTARLSQERAVELAELVRAAAVEIGAVYPE